MAIGPNKNNSSSENNQNRGSPPGDSSRAVHISPPLPRSQSILLGPSAHSPHEDMIRRIVSEEIQVREELGKLFHCNLPLSIPPLTDQNIPARYKLQFTNKVKEETFTTDLVRDETGVPITVEIYDSYTRSRVSPDCFLSSAKVKVMVVDAEYWKNRLNWSRSEFVRNVLREREGKRPILTGPSLTIQLKIGVGTFESIVFNDNSSWTKSGFRLAVMVKGEGEEGYLNGERVQEGVSEPFRVKDRRGKASKKPDRLELTHSVRCIKKIGKDRASCLQKKNINIVENFLELYYNNPSELRNILRIKSESGKEWESMIEHVMQCADEYKNKCIASNNSTLNCMILPHPMEDNLSLSTSGHCVVGLGSSKPNPSESYIIEGDLPAINWQHVPISDIPRMNLSNEPISTGRTVQNIGEMRCAHGNYGGGGDSGGNYSSGSGGGGGGGGNYSSGGNGGGNYGGGGTYGGNYGGGVIDNYGCSGGGNYGGCGGGNYGGCGSGIGNYGGSGGGNYGGGGGIGNYGGSGGGNYVGGGGDNYGCGGGGIDSGTYGGCGNYGGGGCGNYSGSGGGIDNYGGGGIYGGSDNYGGGNYSGGGIDGGAYGGGGGIDNYSGDGIDGGNYGDGGGGNYGGGGSGIGNYSGSGNYGGGGSGSGSDNYGGRGGGNGSSSVNYGRGDGNNYNGAGNYSGGGDDNGNGGGGDGGGGNQFGRSFTARKVGMAVVGLEGLSLEGSQTAG